MTWRFFRIFLLLIYIFVPAAGHGADGDLPSTEALSNRLEKIESSLKSGKTDIGALGKINRELATIRVKAAECITAYEKVVNDKKAALQTLGEKHKKESPDLAKQRKQQEKDLAAAETGLATCSALALQVDSAITEAEKQLQEKLSAQLFARNDNIFQVIAKYRDIQVDWFQQTWAYSEKHGWINKAEPRQLWLLVSTLFLAALAGYLIRHLLLPVVLRVHWSDETSGRFAASFSTSFCQMAPYLLPGIGIAIALYLFTGSMQPTPVITALAYGVCFLLITRFVIQFSLCPVLPGKLFLNVKPQPAAALARRLQVLAIIIFLGYLLVDTLIGSSLPVYAYRLANITLHIAFAINLIWILWLFRDLRGILKQVWLRYSLSLVLVVAVLSDLTGYNNLSSWLLRSVFGSLFVIVVILILGRLTSELLEGLEYGYTSWQRRVRRILGLTPEGHITGFFWFRLLVSLGWWSLLVLSLIFIWDLSASVVENIRVIFTNGFTIGSLTIVPARIVFALVSLGVLVALSAWFQGQMRKRWVSRMPMERGAREALVTIIGYVGVAIAILVTLGIAGIDYANLAIIAGALSVGIGFGLQNIVNNFVSGLILLFERPVKTGDWIVVGNTEGHVKRIRIRATQIQTFDQADVIVPNSELISGQVTNWMLHDPRGRARIPVGVAYGSDTQKVKEVLLAVANNHPDVITNGTAPEPKVLFRQFGDSSLDFELRCFIKNVDDRLNVISDLNFAIDTAFRENGIEIPFPQRDLHVRNWPGKTPDSE